MQQIVLPVRVMKLMGIQKLILSNAAGGLNPQMQISDLMILHDHINLLPENPLTGKNIDEFGVRFPDMFEAYEPAMIKSALTIKNELNVMLHQGVYVSVSGPNLETPAEYHYLRSIGADAVGMSTVPEVIAARQMNLPVFAISVITDLCTPGHIEPVTIDKVLMAAAKAEPELTKVIKSLLLNT
jgi:purine-nucleoside phosphorylase